MKYGYNFYQSTLRQYISRDVFGKPVFEIEREGKEYQVICKEKMIFGVIIVWFQVLGATSYQLPVTSYQLFKKAILEGAKKYYQKKRFLPIYIQFGFTDVLAEYDINQWKQESQVIENEFHNKLVEFQTNAKGAGLVSAKKHNLPDATIVIDLNQPLESLRNQVGRNHKEKINKAKREIQNSKFKIQNSKLLEDAQNFYEWYVGTGDDKGFGVISKMSWGKLFQEGLEQGYGKLFIIKSEETGKMVSGAFCIQDGDTLIYLYGANDRSVGNKGFSQLLHWYIIEYAHKADLKRYDLLGAARLGSKGDWLEKVSQFKLGFGGQKIEYGGSRDLILNKLVYMFYIRL